MGTIFKKLINESTDKKISQQSQHDYLMSRDAGENNTLNKHAYF